MAPVSSGLQNAGCLPVISLTAILSGVVTQIPAVAMAICELQFPARCFSTTSSRSSTMSGVVSM